MANKYQIGERRIVDIDQIQDADMEYTDGLTTVTFRLAGHERPFRIAGPLAETLWRVLCVNAAPVYLPDDVTERPQHPAPAATEVVR